MIQTKHSVSYLEDYQTENWSNFSTPMKWLLNYIRRNKIPATISQIRDGGKTKEYIRLTFRSEHQLRAFQRRGNCFFPSVEFL